MVSSLTFSAARRSTPNTAASFGKFVGGFPLCVVEQKSLRAQKLTAVKVTFWCYCCRSGLLCVLSLLGSSGPAGFELSFFLNACVRVGLVSNQVTNRQFCFQILIVEVN